MDKTVITILIICATLIALAAIGCDFWVEKKTTDTPERIWPNKIIKIHRNYIAGFLGFGIIMLLTAQYGGTCEDLLTYLSFGSTLTSLVLSVLAIFVTVRSSFDLYKQYGTIKQVSEQIGESLRNLKTSETKIGKASSDISTQMERIVDEIEKRINKRIEKNEKRISDLFNEYNSNSTTQSDGNNKNNNYIDKQEFLFNTSRFGLYTLFACVLSKEYNKPFKISDFFSEDRDIGYVFGYIIPLKSAGFLQFERFSLRRILCSKSTFDKSEITSEIINQIKRIKIEEIKERNIQIINDICDFFEEEHLEVEQ